VLLVLALILIVAIAYPALRAQVSSLGAGAATKTVEVKERGFLLLKSALPLAERLLNKVANGGGVTLHDPIFKPLTLQTPLGELEIRIVDLERFLNLNALASSAEARETFKKLIGLANADPTLYDLTLGWLGVQNAFNLPYPPPGRFYSKMELTLFNRDLGEPPLTSLTTALSAGKINVNTAPEEILRAALGDYEAARVAALRRERRIEDLKELLGVGRIDAAALLKLERILTVKSRYFLVEMKLKSSPPVELSFIYDLKERRVIKRTVR